MHGGPAEGSLGARKPRHPITGFPQAHKAMAALDQRLQQKQLQLGGTEAELRDARAQLQEAGAELQARSTFCRINTLP
jgi:hypothetical protein